MDFKPTFDGVIKSEFLTHIDEICHKQTQPSEDLILARNAELRKNPGALYKLGEQEGHVWGEMVADIPFNMWEKAIRDGYPLNHPDADVAATAMANYLLTPEGNACLVKDRGIEMAGAIRYTQATDQTTLKTPDSKLGKAFCAGRAALIAGVNNNPHVSGAEDYLAYEAGYATITPEGKFDSCSIAIPITMPDLTGMTSAVAQAAILTANLTVGKITGTTGVVTVQAPLAAAKTQPNDIVTFTIA